MVKLPLLLLASALLSTKVHCLFVAVNMHVKALSDGIVQAQPYASIERLVPGESSVGMYDPCKADTKKISIFQA